jgi:hydroxymethylpyrimidine pyrophosphatase-like HAD family hydrolase
MMAPKGMVVTDLDGTLFQRERRCSPRNLSTLALLGELGVLRVIATGRHLVSARRVLTEEFPIDYLVFSSGAGILDWKRQRLLRKLNMSQAELVRAFAVVAGLRLDFMLHRPIPENHLFFYYRASDGPNPDFEARCVLYREFASPGAEAASSGRPSALSPPVEQACQILAIEPPSAAASAYPELKAELPEMTVVLTTSPLDGRSRWIEIFSGRVSKALASAWIARRAGLPARGVLAVGNDYNDLDLLCWAGHSYVVDGAPEELARRFPSVGTGDEAGFSEAVELWQRQRAH